MGGHQTRTSVLAWNSRTLASGSRDRNILQHDLRVSSDHVSKLIGHKSEVESNCINGSAQQFLTSHPQIIWTKITCTYGSKKPF